MRNFKRFCKTKGVQEEKLTSAGISKKEGSKYSTPAVQQIVDLESSTQT